MLRVAFTTLLCLVIGSGTVWAQEAVVVAVEDKDYSPYYTWEGDTVRGPCRDIVVGAFDVLEYDVEFVAIPWIRALKMVQDGTVDAALCATRTEEREAYAVFPDEALLSYDATLFVRDDSPLQTADAEALRGKSFAVVKGYSFGGVDSWLEENGMIRQEATTRESLVQVLLAGRVDTVLDTRLPMFHDLERMGVADQVRRLTPSLSETPGYLMFGNHGESGELARAFSEALAVFKNTPEYREIAERYRMDD